MIMGGCAAKSRVFPSMTHRARLHICLYPRYCFDIKKIVVSAQLIDTPENFQSPIFQAAVTAFS